MKKNLALALLCCGVLSANEIERIESIVNDVTKLRQGYETCQQDLERLKAAQTGDQSHMTTTHQNALKEQSDTYERRILALESSLADLREKSRQDQRALKHASTQIEQLNQLVTEQKKHIAVLNSEKSVRVVTKTVTKEAACPEVNPFPELMMKEETIVDKPLVTKKTLPDTTDASVAKGETVYFEASAFRMTADVAIYDAPKGNVVSTWEATTSFTSNQKQGGWLKITGYFVDKKWRPSGNESLWVEERFTKKR